MAWLLADETENLAQTIAGMGANSSRLERAQRVAEAQIDLLRVRRARALLNVAGGARSLRVQVRDFFAPGIGRAPSCAPR